MFEILPKSLIFNTENMFSKSIHLSLDIVDRLNWIWQDQGSLSAIIDIRTATNTTNYDQAHSEKKRNENFCSQRPNKFDIVDRLQRGIGVIHKQNWTSIWQLPEKIY